MLVRQLEEELRMRMRQPNIEMQQQMEAIYAENEHLTREIAILRDTIKVSAMLFTIMKRKKKLQQKLGANDGFDRIKHDFFFN